MSADPKAPEPLSPLAEFERDLRGNARKYIGAGGQTRAVRDFRRTLRRINWEVRGCITPELRTLRKDIQDILVGWMR